MLTNRMWLCVVFTVSTKGRKGLQIGYFNYFLRHKINMKNVLVESLHQVNLSRHHTVEKPKKLEQQHQTVSNMLSILSYFVQFQHQNLIKIETKSEHRRVFSTYQRWRWLSIYLKSYRTRSLCFFVQLAYNTEYILVVPSIQWNEPWNIIVW